MIQNASDYDLLALEMCYLEIYLSQECDEISRFYLPINMVETIKFVLSDCGVEKKHKLIMTWWHHMASKILINIGSGNVL